MKKISHKPVYWDLCNATDIEPEIDDSNLGKNKMSPSWDIVVQIMKTIKFVQTHKPTRNIWKNIQQTTFPINLHRAINGINDMRFKGNFLLIHKMYSHVAFPRKRYIYELPDIANIVPIANTFLALQYPNVLPLEINEMLYQTKHSLISLKIYWKSSIISSERWTLPRNHRVYKSSKPLKC